MAKALIHRPAKSSMSSGLSKYDHWSIEFRDSRPKRLDPLTGWYGGQDTTQQISGLVFETKEAAVAYAEAHGLDYEVEDRRPTPAIKPKSYADNFRTGRPENWTH